MELKTIETLERNPECRRKIDRATEKNIVPDS